MARKTFTLRIEESTLRQLHYVSTKNKRSVNNQIEMMIENLIADFEKEYGAIPLPESE